MEKNLQQIVFKKVATILSGRIKTGNVFMGLYICLEAVYFAWIIFHIEIFLVFTLDSPETDLKLAPGMKPFYL